MYTANAVSSDSFDSLKLRTMTKLLEVSDFDLMKSLSSIVLTFCSVKDNSIETKIKNNVSVFLSKFSDKALLTGTTTVARENGTILIDWNSKNFAAGLNIGTDEFSYAAVRFSDNKDFSGMAELTDDNEINKFSQLIKNLYYGE